MGVGEISAQGDQLACPTNLYVQHGPYTAEYASNEIERAKAILEMQKPIEIRTEFIKVESDRKLGSVSLRTVLEKNNINPDYTLNNINPDHILPLVADKPDKRNVNEYPDYGITLKELPNGAFDWA